MKEEKDIHLKIIKNLCDIDDLPTVPHVVLQLNTVLANPKSSAKDVATLISADQVLTTRILKLVNSAYFGFSRQVTTLSHAIVILGFREIKSLVLSSKIFDLFKSNYTKLKDIFDINLLWTHSLGCAVVARHIGKKIKYPEPETLFIGGLIHDIGKVVEMSCLTDYMPDVFKLIQQKNVFMWEAEYELWNITHAEIGKVLAEMWDFPPLLANVIEHHHHPHLAKEFSKEASIIHLSNYLARVLGIGSGGDSLIPEVNPFSWEQIGLSQIGHEQLLIESLQSVAELGPLFS